MKISRRRFSQLAIATTALALIWKFPIKNMPKASSSIPVSSVKPNYAKLGLQLKVNGIEQNVDVDPRTTLLDLLREQLGLTGSKKGCDHGQCGACTVIVDGRRIYSCLSLAVMHEGADVLTIEGLAAGETLHPMQAEFIAHDGFQCGYCTPGQIMAAVALLKERCGPSDTDVKECMNGNICRCGAYDNIVSAIQSVRKGVKTDASI